MAALTMKVADMACGHCVATIKGAVEKVAGVTGVEADLETKVVTVSCSGEPDPGAIMVAIQKAGYSPEVSK